MTTLAQVRKAASSLPEVTEGTQAGKVTFRVGDRGFVSVTKEGELQVHLDRSDIDGTIGDLPGSEPLMRAGRAFGVRVPLEAINGMQSNALVRRAWLARAPRRLADAARSTDDVEPGAVGDLPKAIGRPATRALAGAGITTLKAVAQRSEAELGALHGVGPKAVRVLAEALRDAGLDFAAGPG